MNKIKLMLLFITSIIVSQNIISMQDDVWQTYDPILFGDDVRTGRYSDTESDSDGEDLDKGLKAIECALCYDDTDKYTELHCGHAYCNICLKALLENAFSQNQLEQVRCPDPSCKEKLTEEDLEAMEDFAGDQIEKVKYKVAENARPVVITRPDWRTALRLYFLATPCPSCGMTVERLSGCPHMTCQNHQCNEHFCYQCGQIWNQTTASSGYRDHANCELNGIAKKGSAIVGSSALVGYGLYRLLKRKPNGEQSWLSKKISQVMQKVKTVASKTISTINDQSHILVPAVVGTGIFAVLTANRINLANPIRIGTNNLLGDYKYFTMIDSPLGKVFENTLGNKHVVNAGLSGVGGLMAGYAYKLLGGLSKPKTRPKLTFGKKNNNI